MEAMANTRRARSVLSSTLAAVAGLWLMLNVTARFAFKDALPFQMATCMVLGSTLAAAAGLWRMLNVTTRLPSKDVLPFRMATFTSAGKTKLLHLAGSPVSRYYNQLSINYMKECVAAVKGPTEDSIEMRYAIVDPAGPSWKFPEDLSDEAIEAAPKLTHAEAIAKISELKPDVVLPHMFCFPGMTTFRALMDMLNLPIVGNPPETMALSTNKGQACAVMGKAGTLVAKSEVIRSGEMPTLKPPFVLKPCSEDNSLGITLVEDEAGLEAGIKAAFEFDDQILVEEFVPLGRELRVSVVERTDGTLKLNPAMEYHLNKESPIRLPGDKITVGASGVPNGFAVVERSLPADVDEELFRKLEQGAVTAHKALGCRDYSLYDVRVSPEGEPYFLEAGLYCSFSPRSPVVLTSGASGEPDMQHVELFKMLVERATKRKRADEGSGTQKMGMKQKAVA